MYTPKNIGHITKCITTVFQFSHLTCTCILKTKYTVKVHIPFLYVMDRLLSTIECKEVTDVILIMKVYTYIKDFKIDICCFLD